MAINFLSKISNFMVVTAFRLYKINEISLDCRYFFHAISPQLC